MTGTLLPAGMLLLALGLLQVRLVRFVSYPPALYCFVWGVALLWIAADPGTFDVVSDRTIGFYVLAALAFSIGGALGWRGFAREAAAGAHGSSLPAPLPPSLVPLLTLVVAILAPVYLRALVAFVGQSSPVEFLYALRVRTLEASVLGGLGVIANVVPFAMLVALLAAAVPAPTTLARVSRAAAIAMALVLSILTGGRGAPLTLIIGLGAVLTVRATRLPLRHVALGLVAGLAVFASMGVLLRKGTARPDATLADNAVALVDNVRLYTLGGVVAFDRILDDPQAVPGNGGFLRTGQELANRLGARYEFPPLHMQFSTIGHALDTNVYTIYFSYLPFVGVGATLVILALLGGLSARVHRSALGGSLTALMFHAVLVGAVPVSVFSDGFVSNLNFFAKLGAFMLALHIAAWLFPAPARQGAHAAPLGRTA